MEHCQSDPSSRNIMEVTSAQKSTVTTANNQISRRGYKSKAYLIPKGVRQEKARGNLYSCSQCASLIWRATTASLPWKRHNLQRQDLLLLLDPNPLAATISMFWLIKAPPARSRGKMSFRCQFSHFICICHTSHCARCLIYISSFPPLSFGHICTIALFRASEVLLEIYITAGILTLPPLSSQPSSPRAEQSACWALVLDQWPAYWSVTSRSQGQTPSGIWSPDLHTLRSYDWRLKICPADRMAKNGDSKWPRIECRKLRQGCHVNLPWKQFSGKFSCNPGVTIMWPRRQLENGPLTYSGRNI